MWLDDARGHVVDWVTQRWVQLSGRTVSLADDAWLDGPVGQPTGIGAAFFDSYAAERGLRVLRGQSTGLVHDFGVLRSAAFDPTAVSPEVIDFYARTSAYELDAWSQWCGAFRPFGWALAVLFSRRLQQLNVPLSGLDTSRGMTSEVFPIVDASTNRSVWTAWVRQLVGTGNVIYAGAYSTCTVPDGATPCVRVVFPLPNGNGAVHVILQMHVRPAAASYGADLRANLHELRWHIGVFVVGGTACWDYDSRVGPNDFRDMFFFAVLVYALSVALVTAIGRARVGLPMRLALAPFAIYAWLWLGWDGNTAKAGQILSAGQDPAFVPRSAKHRVMLAWHDALDRWLGDR